MLKRIERPRPLAGISIKEASFPAPFASGLEYASPARGTWNIVHTGMLIPEAHQIFVCAASCLRGVVLTAAELGMAHRFSTVEVKENNLFDGSMEDLVIEGVSDIIEKLPQRPPVVLVYTSCVHHFAGCDLGMIYAQLRDRFPDIDFADCYMTPIMRKSGLTPDQLMRSRLYMPLKQRPIRSDAVALIGSDLPLDEDSDLIFASLRHVVAGIVEQARSEGILHADADADGTTDAIFSMIRGLYDHAATATPEQYAATHHAIGLLLRGSLFDGTRPA